MAVGIGLLAYVVTLAASPEGGGQLWQICARVWWLFLLLTPPYLALRAWVWRQLLRQQGIEVPWQPMLVSFASGEITKNLPAGIYVQNYLLARLEHFGDEKMARAMMASTAMLALEAALAVPVAVVLGWPGAPWVRWTLLAVVGVWVVALGLAWLLVEYSSRIIPAGAPAGVRRVIHFLDEFFEAGARLVSWRTLWSLVPTALSMLVYVVYLAAIIRALDIRQVGFLDAVAMQAFIVLSVILVPIPTEVGLTEFTGLMALSAHGIPPATAAVIMLALRALATGMTIAASAVILVALRDLWLHRGKEATHLPAHGAELPWSAGRSEPRSQVR